MFHANMTVSECFCGAVLDTFTYMQIARLPKENGARGRTVVITQGSLPTVVAQEGKVQLLPQ